MHLRTKATCVGPNHPGSLAGLQLERLETFRTIIPQHGLMQISTGNLPTRFANPPPII